MKSIFQICEELLRDEWGAILSAEAALLGTVGVLGAGVGLSSVAESVDQEMKDVAFAIRSLDQSYSFNGMGDRCRCSKAWTAGSSFIQKPVAEAHADLQRHIDALERDEADAESAEQVKSEPTPAGQQQAVAPKKSPKKKQADAEREQVKKRQQETKKRAQKQKEAKRKAEMKKREAEKKRQKERENEKA